MVTTCCMVWLIASLSLEEVAISTSALLVLAVENSSHWSGFMILHTQSLMNTISCTIAMKHRVMNIL